MRSRSIIIGVAVFAAALLAAAPLMAQDAEPTVPVPEETTTAPGVIPEGAIPVPDPMDPAEGSDAYEIDTGSPFGKIKVGPIISQSLGLFKMPSTSYDQTPGDSKRIEAPPGSVNTIGLNLVQGWDRVPAGTTTTDIDGGVLVSDLVSYTLGSSPVSIVATEIWAVAFDQTAEFRGYETVRCYLNRGGYIVVTGKYKDVNERWERACGYGHMPAEAVSQ